MNETGSATPPGKIVWLSGPSSCGKTTATGFLEKQGWKRIEADAERIHVEVTFLKKSNLEDFEFFLSHYSQPLTSLDICGAVYNDLKPTKAPADEVRYKRVQSNMLEILKTKQDDVEQALLVHMLDKAIAIAKQGTHVILDHVPLINDKGFYSKDVERDKTSPNLWCYGNFKIEQQLKYVPVGILMRNVIRRNQNACATGNHDDLRPMPMVLGQYSMRFVALDSKSGKKTDLGAMKVGDLKKWISRAMKIEFFDINPHYVFKIDPTVSDEQLDKAIQERLDGFIKNMGEKNPIDPVGEAVDKANMEKLKAKEKIYGTDPKMEKLHAEIAERTKEILQRMNIRLDAEDDSIVHLTYLSDSKIEPTII